jgi:hypothetical protein
LVAESGVPIQRPRHVEVRPFPSNNTVKAAPRMTGARFITIDRRGHLFLGHDAGVRKQTTAFIRDVVPGNR